jgi:hypothetical protein
MSNELTIIRQLSYGKHKPVEVEIGFTDTAGAEQSLRLSKSTLTNLRLLHQKLIDADANLSTNFKAASGFLAGLQNESRKAKTVRVTRIGWSDDLSSFAFPKRVIHSGTDENPPVAPASVDDNWEFKLPISGTVEGWANAIKPASMSSAMTFLAVVPFAAPCLRLLGRPSFGFMLYGPAKIGKSTATLIGGSVFGFADEMSLPSFSATQAAIGELGAVFNDMVSPINELGAATGNVGELASLLKALAYQSGESKTKRYSTILQKTGAVSRPEQARGIVVMNSEVSAGQIARASRRSRFEGEAIRLIDLPLRAQGQKTVFDLSKTPNDVALSKKRCKQIQTGIAKNHGKASRKFVEHLVRNVKEAKSTLLAAMDGFSTELPEAETPEASHMADNFALIYAAGIIAIELGILPFTEVQIRRATIVCFDRACRSLPSDENRAQDAYDLLEADFKAKVFPLQSNTDDESIGNEDGYVSDDGELVLKGEYLAQRFSSENEAFLLVRKLHSMRLLQKKIKVPATPTNSIRWAQTQKSWPDGRRRRSIVIDTK